MTRDKTHKPGMCPDVESNWGPFGLQDDAQPTEPHQSGLVSRVLDKGYRHYVLPITLI